jgi:phage FluMu protein Com
MTKPTDERRGEPAADQGTDARCHCGNLLARLTARGVEIKCRRCKRVHIVPLAAATAGRRRGPPRAGPSDDNPTARGVSPEPGRRRPPGSFVSPADEDD